MSLERFDKLRERLLHAGIAPRHVRRYVSELRDHFDDLTREAIANGLKQGEAEDAARARIGGDHELAAVMLARPELRSVTARFPWAAFGVGPVLMLALVVYAALLIEAAMIFSGPVIPQSSIAWARRSFDVLNWLTTYAAPLLIAAVLFMIGIRQRMTMRWIALGLTVICFVGGFHEIGVKWSSVPSQPSELYVGFAFAPPFPGAMILSGLLRSVINIAVVGAAYWLWTRMVPAIVESSPS